MTLPAPRLLAPRPADPAEPATPVSEPIPLTPGSSAKAPPSAMLLADCAAGLIDPADIPREATELSSDPPSLAGDIRPLTLEMTSDGELACSPDDPRSASTDCTVSATDEPSDWATAPA